MQRQMQEQTVKVFAFGSLSIEQLRTKGVRIIYNEGAKLLHYARVFAQSTTKINDGGKAHLVYLLDGQDGYVLGTCYTIPISHLSNINAREGINLQNGKYERVTIAVYLKESQRTEYVYTYVMRKEFVESNRIVGDCLPSASYLQLVCDNLNQHWKKVEPNQHTGQKYLRPFRSSDIPLHSGKRFWGQNPPYGKVRPYQSNI
jgi:cation transport regulator ChaC